MIHAVLLLLLLAHDDGRYASSPLKPWMDSLGNRLHEPCCSYADGVSIPDVDWDTKDGSYRVRLCATFQPSEGWANCANKDWIVVPNSAVVDGPNRLGPAIVWPTVNGGGHTLVRCFMPGAQG